MVLALALALAVVPAVDAQATVEQLQYLFDRPSEPIFLPKEGDKTDKKVVFDVPNEYLVRMTYTALRALLSLVLSPRLAVLDSRKKRISSCSEEFVVGANSNRYNRDSSILDDDALILSTRCEKTSCES